MYSYLKENIESVKAHIQSACVKAGRSVDAVALLGVTKTYEADVMNAAIEYGITDIAENKVQEILRKYDDVNKGVNWHLIGHLQSNKVKYIIDKVELIHSVDSLKLAVEIDKRAGQIHKIQDVLIQINIQDEASKFGILPSELGALLEGMSTLKHIRICGLMYIAPIVEKSEQLRDDFRLMKKMFDDLNNTPYSNVEPLHLSMGMSSDYEVAIEEGATMVRIGTKIFGKRTYQTK
ncbi:YggS family pyridoxal phosphate-dependent enzyme [Fusibacter ferrireducens]|uniref:Pyridoxal phosphate homeostasis protein n=1 Tax=Fusibacter ferrireducens TaxID=2785058 RepID=A0ABR9ZNY5_9FIRM|nr:YggS family pyridoxal phosphate-dependent enzyme [Fusibacter ferrireducens]MBF4691635.1 YggS family pyridoxal phosphate-dependent enzyme [Fusibacter ferrireducens]